MAATELQADVIARRMGASPAVIDKRPGDTRPYLVDLRPLLMAGEIALAVGQVQAPGLDIGRARPRSGLFIELEIGGGTVAEGQHSTSFALSVVVTTTRGALQVELDVVVHRR
jgi:hypothetical protein